MLQLITNQGDNEQSYTPRTFIHYTITWNIWKTLTKTSSTNSHFIKGATPASWAKIFIHCTSDKTHEIKYENDTYKYNENPPIINMQENRSSKIKDKLFQTSKCINNPIRPSIRLAKFSRRDTSSKLSDDQMKWSSHQYISSVRGSIFLIRPNNARTNKIMCKNNIPWWQAHQDSSIIQNKPPKSAK